MKIYKTDVSAINSLPLMASADWTNSVTALATMRELRARVCLPSWVGLSTT